MSGKGQIPYKPRRFDLDVLARLFLKYPASPLGSIVIAAVLYRRARHTTALGCTFFDYLQLNKKLAAFLAFVLAKTLSGLASKYAHNHSLTPDKPRWASGREIVVITGASGGIGGAIVQKLLKKTNKIAIIDIGPPSYPTGPARYYKGDVTNAEAIHEIAEKIRRDLGEPTIVIANAGIAGGRKIIDCPPQHFEHVFKVNTLGAFILYKEFLPHLIKKNHGHIVTVGSSASYMAIPQLVEYTASKSAVLGLHEVIVQELYWRYNAPKVRCTFVCPSKVRTQLGEGMVDNETQFLAPTIWPEEVAEAVVKQIDSGFGGTIMQPFHAALLLPPIRAMPEWFRWGVHLSGKTYETVTDKSSADARQNYRLTEEEMGLSSTQKK